MNNIGPWIEHAQSNISPYLASAWLTAAALMNPVVTEVSHSLMAKVMPYAFVALFFSWCILSVAYFVHIGIQRRWFLLFRDVVFDVVKTAWRYMKMIGEFYAAKVVIGLMVCTIGVLAPQWFYHHFDPFRMAREFSLFVVRVIRSIFDVHQLVLAIHQWLNALFLSVPIAIYRSMLEAAQKIVADYPWYGLVLIVSLAIILVILLVMFAGCMSGQQAPAPAAAAAQGQQPGPGANGTGRRRRRGAGADDDGSDDDDYYNGDSDASAAVHKRVTVSRRRD